MSILIVEDNPVNAIVLESFLQKGGYQTAVARNAQDALARIPNIQDLQLIITDLSMPEMDGLEFIANLRGVPATKYLPIIIVTAHSGVENVNRAKDLECAAYLVKPVDKNQLLNRVESLLKGQLPVLQDKHCVMNNLGVGTQEYDDLITAFAAQVATAIPIVVLEQAGSDEAISESLSLLLKELAESAAILGAVRFATLYSKLNGGSSITRPNCVEVLKALQELEFVLMAKSKPSLKPKALT